jgi:uncharacterized membrane protein
MKAVAFLLLGAALCGTLYCDIRKSVCRIFAMKTERMVQSLIFLVSIVLLLFLLLEAIVRVELAREFVAIFVCLICLSAELYVVFVVGQQLWQWSGKFTGRLLRTLRRDAASSGFLSETKRYRGRK